MYGGKNSYLSLPIIGRESHTTTRTMKEAMFIRLMTHPSIGTLISTGCTTYGMKSCLIPPAYTSKRLSSQAYCARLTTQAFHQNRGAHTLHPHHQLLVGMGYISY